MKGHSFHILCPFGKMKLKMFRLVSLLTNDPGTWEKEKKSRMTPNCWNHEMRLSSLPTPQMLSTTEGSAAATDGGGGFSVGA